MNINFDVRTEHKCNEIEFFLKFLVSEKCKFSLLESVEQPLFSYYIQNFSTSKTIKNLARIKLGYIRSNSISAAKCIWKWNDNISSNNSAFFSYNFYQNLPLNIDYGNKKLRKAKKFVLHFLGIQFPLVLVQIILTYLTFEQEIEIILLTSKTESYSCLLCKKNKNKVRFNLDWGPKGAIGAIGAIGTCTLGQSNYILPQTLKTYTKTFQIQQIVYPYKILTNKNKQNKHWKNGKKRGKHKIAPKKR